MSKRIYITESAFSRLFENEGGLFANEYSDEENKKWSDNNKKKEIEKEKKETIKKKNAEKAQKAKERREKKAKEKAKQYDNAINTAFGYKKNLFSDEEPSKEERDKAKEYLRNNKTKKKNN